VFPTVAVHDLLVHPREEDLIIGTHGRSIWTIDISGLEGLTEDVLQQGAAIFAPQTVLRLGLVSGLSWAGDRIWQARNTQPGTRIFFYLKSDAKEDPKIEITDASGKSVQSLTGSRKAGLNVVLWSGRSGGQVAAPGDYPVTLKVGGKEYRTSVRVEDAPLAP
jgi:hypothetical protein